MSLSRLLAALNQLPQSGSYAQCKVISHEDDQKSDFWYILLVNKNLQYPATYLNLHGALSATFMLDSTLKSLDVQALITFNSTTDDITVHHIGVGKLHLPGIANSSGMKYGIVDVELSVSQFIQHLPTTCPAVAMASMVKPVGTIEFEVSKDLKVGVMPQCDCGGHKTGYRNDELHGHARWCKLVLHAQA